MQAVTDDVRNSTYLHNWKHENVLLMSGEVLHARIHREGIDESYLYRMVLEEPKKE